MPGIDPAIANRLAKIVGLLASDHDGEVVAAGRAATRLLRDAGLTWPDILAPALPPPRPQPRPFYHAPIAPHVAKARWALQFPKNLSVWEHKFLSDLVQRPRLSPKQSAILDGIIAQLRGGGGH